jgi:hypothetical protein
MYRTMSYPPLYRPKQRGVENVKQSKTFTQRQQLP